ncbi:hypothetical protein AVEN_244306-1 [Araneus ventricosus]|uniref:Uncharacterized protein n=1 Tax=Araneus ventricosus TaxID=182803 RepID=A0A4Y2HRC8_ARAVE|nr:hypothetical protein AVEN_244306-1 [Araneus ventricosus]
MTLPPPRQAVGHCGPRLIALITSGSCDDPSERDTTRPRWGIIQLTPLLYPTGKRDSAYTDGKKVKQFPVERDEPRSFSSSSLSGMSLKCPCGRIVTVKCKLDSLHCIDEVQGQVV